MVGTKVVGVADTTIKASILHEVVVQAEIEYFLVVIVSVVSVRMSGFMFEVCRCDVKSVFSNKADKSMAVIIGHNAL